MLEKGWRAGAITSSERLLEVLEIVELSEREIKLLDEMSMTESGARLISARLLADEGEIEQAIVILRALVESDDGVGDRAAGFLGVLLYGLQPEADVEALLCRGVASEPPAAAALAHLLSSRGKHDEARRLLDDGFARHAGVIGPSLAGFLIAHGDLVRAEEVLRHLDPGDPLVAWGFFLLFSENGLSVEAHFHYWEAHKAGSLDAVQTRPPDRGDEAPDDIYREVAAIVTHVIDHYADQAIFALEWISDDESVAIGSLTVLRDEQEQYSITFGDGMASIDGRFWPELSAKDAATAAERIAWVTDMVDRIARFGILKVTKRRTRWYKLVVPISTSEVSELHASSELAVHSLATPWR